MKIPTISAKRMRALRGIFKGMATAGGKVLTSNAGKDTILQAGGKAFRKFKKGGWNLASVGEAAKEFGKATGTGFAKIATKKPTKTLPELHAAYVAKHEAKYGARTKEEIAKNLPHKGWPAHIRNAFIGTPAEYGTVRAKIEGVDYASAPEDIRRRHMIASRVAKGLLGTGMIGLVGFSANKAKAQGYVQGPRGGRFEASAHGMNLENPEGRGSSVQAAVRYKHPRGHLAELGGSVGFGHAKKAGWAHQAGAHVKLHTPIFKTGWEVGEQHAFGTKSRSRRVAAIRRAVFGSEQHLGISAKPTKKAKKSDSLMI